MYKMYRRIESLLIRKSEYNNREEMLQTLSKIVPQADIIDDYYKVYLIDGEEIVRLSVLNGNKVSIYL